MSFRACYITVPSAIGYPVCTVCKEGLPKERRALLHHIRNKHSCTFKESEKIVEEVESVLRLVPLCPLQDAYVCKTQQESVVFLPYVSCLPVVDLLKCPTCSFFSVSRHGLRMHYSRAHGLCIEEVQKRSIHEQTVFRGQAFWRFPAWRQYWILKNEDHCIDNIPRSTIVKSMIAAEVEKKTDSVVVRSDYERSRFSILAKLEEKIKMIGLSWDEAANLTSGSVCPDDCFDGQVLEKLSLSIKAFFEEGRACVENEQIWMNQDHILRLVAAPGVSSKTKLFRFCLKRSEERYGRHIRRVILMILRVWCSKRQECGFRNLPPLSKELDDAVTSLVAFMTQDGTEHSQNEEMPNPDSSFHRGNASMSQTTPELDCTKENRVVLAGAAQPTQSFGGRIDQHAASHVGFYHIFKILSLFLQERQSVEKDSVPTMACLFTAAIGVVRTRQGVTQVAVGRQISPLLAAVGYSSSICGILSLVRFPKFRSRKEEMDHICQMQAPGQCTGLNLVQELLAKTRMTRASEERRAWWVSCDEEGHRNCGVSHGIHLSALETGNVVRKLQKDLFSKLFGDCGLFPNLASENVPWSALDEVRDDMENISAEYWFPEHAKNRPVVLQFHQYVKRRVLQFDKHNNHIDLHEEAKKVLFQIKEFSDVLFACLVLSTGMPGRGRESAFQTIRNSRTGGPRAIFLYNGIVAIVPNMSKSDWTGTASFFVARFSDQTTSFLFKLFALLVVPLRRCLRNGLKLQLGPESEVEHSLDDNDENNYILGSFHARCQAAARLSEIWKRFEFPMSLAQYRQWCGGYARNKSKTSAVMACLQKCIEDCCMTSESDSNELECGDLMQMQMNHSLKTAKEYYGCDSLIGGRNRLVDGRNFASFFAASKEWHSDANIVEKKYYHIRESDINKTGERALTSKRKKPDNNDNSCQSEKKQRIVTSDSSSRAYLSPSEKSNDEDVADNSKNLIESFRDEIHDVGDDFLLQVLRIGTGSQNAQFLSQTQKQGMRAILDREHDVILVDRTGGGKSALMLGPAAVEDGVSIVFIPLAALKLDLLHIARHFGISATEFKSLLEEHKPFPKHGIIVCSPEELECFYEKYEEMVRTLFSWKRLKRFVVDEAHITLLSDNYRDSMAYMKRIRPCNVHAPIVLMSATVPVLLETDVLAAHGCNNTNVRKIRGDLSRKNVAIRVELLADSSDECLIESARKQLITQVYDPNVLPGKHVVVVLSRRTCSTISSRLLRCKALQDSVCIRQHHGDLSETDRRAAINAWHDHSRSHMGQDFVMICTEGFSTGINAPDVRSVIICGCSRSIIEAWQSIGRAGRDGTMAEAVMLYHPAYLIRAAVKHSRGVQLLKDFQSWIENNDHCLPMAAELYLGSTGKTAKCTDVTAGRTSCSNCFKSINKKNNAPRTTTEYQSAQSLPQASRNVLLGESTEGTKSFCFRKKIILSSPAAEMITSDMCGLSSNVSDVISRLRTIAHQVGNQCVPCLLKSGKAGPSTLLKSSSASCHSLYCYDGGCLICLDKSHSAGKCTRVLKPDTKRRSCRWCFINYVRGKRIHHGYGTLQNEYGSKLNCPFQNIVSLAIACWNRESYKSSMISSHWLRGRLLADSDDLQFFNWLVKENSTSDNGIVFFANYAFDHFDLRK